VKAWTETQACRSRAHCAACLAGKWHKLDACPFGVTVPPSPQLDAALQAQARGEVYAPPGRCKGCGN
jgi:hypothetical protein